MQITQNLLQGFHIAVNNRDIRIAKNNMKVSDLQLKLQVATTVSAALNLYWDLVSFIDAVRIKEQALATSQKLYDDDQKMVKIGSLPAVEVTRAAAQVSVSKEDLLIAQTNVQQQEIVLKNALSRNAMANAWLDDVHIVPLNPIEVPKTDELKPLPELMPEAMSNRVEIEQSEVNIDSQKIADPGLPERTAAQFCRRFAELTNNGLSGPVNPTLCTTCGVPDPYFIGGTGNALAQVFPPRFPELLRRASLTIPFRNRAAQADYVTDQLQLRQAELQIAARRQPGDGGCEDRADRAAAGSRALRDRGGHQKPGGTEPERRSKTGSSTACPGHAGDSGAAGPGHRPRRRSAGHGQLHARQDRV